MQLIKKILLIFPCNNQKINGAQINHENTQGKKYKNKYLNFIFFVTLKFFLQIIIHKIQKIIKDARKHKK